MQIKISMKYHITPAKQVKSLRLYIIKHQRRHESIETFIHCSMNHKLQNFYKRIGFTEYEIHVPHDPPILLLGFNKLDNSYLCIQNTYAFIAA